PVQPRADHRGELRDGSEPRRVAFRSPRVSPSGAGDDSLGAQLGRLRLRLPVPGSGGGARVPDRGHPDAGAILRGGLVDQLSTEHPLRDELPLHGGPVSPPPLPDVEVSAVRAEVREPRPRISERANFAAGLVSRSGAPVEAFEGRRIPNNVFFIAKCPLRSTPSPGPS